MSLQVVKELNIRLGVIQEAAERARKTLEVCVLHDKSKISTIKKDLDEIKQYEQSARLDFEYLLSKEGG